MKMLNSFLALVVSGRVDQLGMIAALASLRACLNTWNTRFVNVSWMWIGQQRGRLMSYYVKIRKRFLEISGHEPPKHVVRLFPSFVDGSWKNIGKFFGKVSLG